MDIYLGIMVTAVGYGIWYHILKKYDVNQAMPFLLLLPVSSIIGAVLFLGERPNPNTILGGTIIIIGVAVIIFDGQRIASSKKSNVWTDKERFGCDVLLQHTYYHGFGIKHDSGR